MLTEELMRALMHAAGAVHEELMDGLGNSDVDQEGLGEELAATAMLEAFLAYLLGEYVLRPGFMLDRIFKKAGLI